MYAPQPAFCLIWNIYVLVESLCCKYFILFGALNRAPMNSYFSLPQNRHYTDLYREQHFCISPILVIPTKWKILLQVNRGTSVPSLHLQWFSSLNVTFRSTHVVLDYLFTLFITNRDNTPELLSLVIYGNIQQKINKQLVLFCCYSFDNSYPLPRATNKN